MLYRINAHGGYVLELPDGDHLGVQFASGRPYEPWVLRVAAALVPEGGIFVDVGAHVGNHTMFMATGGARVVAVEPHPDTCAILERNVDRNAVSTRVRIVNAALGDSPGSASISTADERNSGGATVSRGTGDVRVITLDSLDLTPDVVKIDVEGSEDEVLAGAALTLRRSKPALLLERHSGPVMEALRSYGYRRIGGTLAASPTFLYVAQVRHLKAVSWAAAGTARHTARRIRRAISAM